MKVNLTVIKSAHGGHYATRTFGEKTPSLMGHNDTTVFILTKDLEDRSALPELEAEARTEARKRGIARVTNLMEN